MHSKYSIFMSSFVLYLSISTIILSLFYDENNYFIITRFIILLSILAIGFVIIFFQKIESAGNKWRQGEPFSIE